MSGIEQLRTERDALMRDRLLLAFLVVSLADHGYEEAWWRLQRQGYIIDLAMRVLNASDWLPPGAEQHP